MVFHVMGGGGVQTVAFLMKNFNYPPIHLNPRHLPNAQTKAAYKKLRAMPVVRSGGDPHASKFILVILFGNRGNREPGTDGTFSDSLSWDGTFSL